MYPAFVGSIVLLVTFFLMIYLVPQMTGFIRNMGQDIPLQTRILMVVSSVLRQLLVGDPRRAVRRLGRPQVRDPRPTRRVAYAVDHYKITVPLIGPILRKIILVALRLELRHDVRARASPCSTRSAAARRSSATGRWSTRCARAGQQIAEGKNLTAAFQDLALFPPLVIRMLRIGEATGALDTALLNVSYFYNREVRDADRQAAGDDRARAHGGARRDPRLGDAVGARPGVRRDLEDEVLTMARHLLYFTAEDHYLYSSSGGRLELEAKFAGDDLGVSAFRDHLRGRKGALFAVVADLAGEDFHEEQVPLLARQRPRGDRAAAPRAALPRHAARHGALARPGRRTAAAQREAAARLVHQHAAVRALARRARGSRRAARRRLLGAAARAGARRPARRARPARARRHREPRRAAPVLRRGRQAALRAPGAHRRDGAAGARRVRALGDPAAGAVPDDAARAAARQHGRCPCWWSRRRASAPRSSRRWYPTRASRSRPSMPRRRATAVEAARTLRRARRRGALPAPRRAQAAARAVRRAAATAGATCVWQLQRAIVAAGALGFAACALYAGTRWYEAYDAREPRRGSRYARRAARAERYARITAAFPVTQTTTENLRVDRGRVPPHRGAQRLARAPRSSTCRACWTDSRKWRSTPSTGVLKPGEQREAETAAPAPGAGRARRAGGLQFEISGRVSTPRSATTTAASPRRCSASPRRWRAAGYQLARTQLPFDVTSEGTLTGDIGGRESSEAPRFTITLSREAAMTFTAEELRKLALPALAALRR